jgi:hypothetical protein
MQRDDKRMVRPGGVLDFDLRQRWMTNSSFEIETGAVGEILDLGQTGGVVSSLDFLQVTTTLMHKQIRNSR